MNTTHTNKLNRSLAIKSKKKKKKTIILTHEEMGEETYITYLCT